MFPLLGIKTAYPFLEYCHGERMCRFAAELEDSFGELQTPENKSWPLLLEAVIALSQQAAIFKRESLSLGMIESLLIHSKFRARAPRLQCHQHHSTDKRKSMGQDQRMSLMRTRTKRLPYDLGFSAHTSLCRRHNRQRRDSLA